MKNKLKILLIFFIFTLFINTFLATDESNEYSFRNEDIVFEKGVIHLYWYYNAILGIDIVSIDNLPKKQRSFNENKMTILKEKLNNILKEKEIDYIRDTNRETSIIELEIDIEGFEKSILQYDGQYIELMLLIENPNLSEIENFINDKQTLYEDVWSIIGEIIGGDLTDIINAEFGEEIFGSYVWGKNEGYPENYRDYFRGSDYGHDYKIGSSLVPIWNITLYYPKFEKEKFENRIGFEIFPQEPGESGIFYYWDKSCKITIINREFRNLNEDRVHALDFDNNPIILHGELYRIVRTGYNAEINNILKSEIELSEKYRNVEFKNMDDFLVFDDYYLERIEKVWILKNFIEKSKEMINYYIYLLDVMAAHENLESYPHTYAHIKNIQNNMENVTIGRVDELEKLVIELEKNLKESRSRKEFAYLTFISEQNSEMISESRTMVHFTKAMVILTFLSVSFNIVYIIYIHKKQKEINISESGKSWKKNN